MEAAAHGHSTLGIPEEVGKEFVAADEDTTPVVKQCAGVLYRYKDRYRHKEMYLLIKRSDNGVWEAPGGHLETGEDFRQAAARESVEEIGWAALNPFHLVSLKKSDNIEYATFVSELGWAGNEVDAYKLNGDEVLEACWFTADELPDSTRPEVRAIITALSGNELDVAKAIRDDILVSPQFHMGMWLFDMRITGTGVAHRSGEGGGFAYRNPKDYLTDEFLQRCNGLPVIFGHADPDVLNYDEFRDRVVGSVILPYVKDEEVWGLAKIYDGAAANLMMVTHRSTSPNVVSAGVVKIVNGTKILIEGAPDYLDHLAICAKGVWDKLQEPQGINLGEKKMDEMLETAATAPNVPPVVAEAPAWLGSFKDEIKCALKDSTDALNARMDAFELKNETPEAIMDEADPEKDIKALADAEDSQNMKKEMDELKSRMDEYHTPISDEEKNEISKARARADAVLEMYGEKASQPNYNESSLSFRTRLVNGIKKLAPTFQNLSLDGLKDAAFDLVEGQIYLDAEKNAENVARNTKGRLIKRTYKDEVGREITKFEGDPKEWLGFFTKPSISVNIVKPGA